MTHATPADPRSQQSETTHGVSHIVPLKLLVAVFAALIVFTGLTVLVSYLDLGNIALYVAMAIALTKAILVALFFMHLRWDKGFNLIVFFSCLFFVTLFITLALTDTAQYQRQINPGDAPSIAHKRLGAEAGQPH